jgi:integrase
LSNQQEGNPKTKIPGEGEAIIIESPAEVLEREEADRKRRDDEYKQHQLGFDKWLTIFTLCLVLTSIFSDVIIWYQGQTARTAADAAQESAAAANNAARLSGNALILSRDQFRLDQRAWIGVDSFGLIAETNKPLEEIILFRKPDQQASALTPEEAHRLLEPAKDFCPNRYPLFLTALRAGLREGELAALRWGDVQFGASGDDSNRYVLVQRNYDPRSGRFLTPKSNKPRRVDLSRELRRVLLELRDQRLFEAFERGQESIADDLVFPSEVNTVLEMSNVVRRDFLPLLERAGLRRIRFHDLRQHADSRIMPNLTKRLFRPLHLALLSALS